MLLGADLDRVTGLAELAALLEGCPWTELTSARWLSLQAATTERYIAVLARPGLSLEHNARCSGLSMVSQLERIGVLLIKERPSEERLPAATSSSRIQLAGGSICSTHLMLDDLLVRKTLRFTLLSEQDGRERHEAEFEFMSAVPVACQYLFPIAKMIRSSCAESGLSLEMEFVRGYTVGERVLRGELTGYNLCAIVSNLAEHLRETLWCSRSESSQRSYFDIIRRRAVDLMQHHVFGRLWVDGAIVNGVRIPGLHALLGAAERTWPQLACLRGTGAHGDLILEDIVLVHEPCGAQIIKLVDPNPQNVSWLIDLAKLMMSARLRYELIYAGLFVCEWKISDGAVEVSFDIDASRSQACLDELAEHLWKVAAETAQAEGTVGVSREMLEAQACLNMLALPSFHQIHHREEARSILFAAVAMARLLGLIVNGFE